MALFANPNDIRLLQQLLKPPDESSDSEDDLPSAGIQKFGPGNIGNKKTTNNTATNESLASQNDKKEQPKNNIPYHDDTPKTFEEWEAQQEKDIELLDTRKCPEYKVAYKQAVTTEDIFLQMGNKTTATASCEDMILKISMPDETVDIERMELSVSPDDIDLQTPIYRLKLALMQTIDPDKGKAAWDSESRIMTLTLRLKRELDFVNF